MLVYKIIMLCCVLLCWFVMFLYCFVQTCFSLLQWHHGTLQLNVFIPTPVSHHIYLLSQPTQSTPLFGTTQMTRNVSFIHDTSSTDIFSFSQSTKLNMFLTTQVIHHTYLYTHPTQSTHVFSSNADDPKCFLKIYNYYPDIVYF